MLGAVAEASYGIPNEIAGKALSYKDSDLADYYTERADELYGY